MVSMQTQFRDLEGKPSPKKPQLIHCSNRGILLAKMTYGGAGSNRQFLAKLFEAYRSK